MKKTRVNLAEKYPNYFAATEMPADDCFAELTDADISRLEKLEAKLTPAAPAAAAEAPAAEAPAPAAPAAAAPVEDPRIKALEDSIAELKAQLNGSPAAAHTAVTTDASAEGKNGNATDRVKGETEQMLDKLLGLG